jgi:hypothetical protein
MRFPTHLLEPAAGNNRRAVERSLHRRKVLRKRNHDAANCPNRQTEYNSFLATGHLYSLVSRRLFLCP